MNRVADMLDVVAARHPGQLVVVACHAGVVEASLLAKLPVVGGLRVPACSCAPGTPR